MQPAMPPPRSPSRSFRGPQDPTMASTMRGNAPHVLKRSFSTPSVGGVASTSFLESQQLAPQMSEKKRNKLGYHRTSIACGHCRRRKIRCIISSEDQNRCVNCIRLKKECSFHPVDQQQPYDQKLPPQTPTGSSIATASSSPAISRGSSVDQGGSQRPNYSAIPVAQVPNMGASTPQSEYFPQTLEGSANPMQSGSSYGVSEQQPSRGWAPTDTDPSAMSKPRGQTMWQQSYQGDVSMGLGGPISPYADPSNVSPAWSNSNFGPGNGMGWNSGMPPPPRSMSFSGEILGSHHTPQYYPAPHHNPVYERQPHHFTHIYGAAPVSETDENIEQAIDPAIMGTAVPSATPIAWQQQQQQQQQPQQTQQPQHPHQHQQVQDTQVGGAYRGWPGYSEGNGAGRM
ncbi:hypothetical protein ACQKWADRAFT_243191 [Trichoderma austrokoningii]